MKVSLGLGDDSISQELIYELICKMEEKGVSRKELGKGLGKSKKYVKKLFSGEKELRLIELGKILEVLNLDISFRFV